MAKLTDAGSTASFAWARRARGSGPEAATALAVSGTSLYVARWFNGPAATFGSTSFASNSTLDLFVAKLVDTGSPGTIGWAQRAGGFGTGTFGSRTIGQSLAVHGTQVYAAGNFNGGVINFGSLSNTHPYPGPYRFAGWLASLTDLTLAASQAAAPAEGTRLFPNPAQARATLRLPPGATSRPLLLTNTLADWCGATRRPPGPRPRWTCAGYPLAYTCCTAGLRCSA